MNTFLKLVNSLALVIIGAVTGIFGLFEVIDPGGVFVQGGSVSHPTILAWFTLISGFGLAVLSMKNAVNIITGKIDKAELHD